MTERKPANLSVSSWIELQIREAQERGEFDDLPGKGKPLTGLDGHHDELWWVRQWLAREGISYLPPALAIRREAEVVFEEIGGLSSEEAVRRVVGDLNDRIRQINRMPDLDGPPSTLMPLDVEAVVARWRTTHEPASDAAADASVAGPVEVTPPVARRRWFRGRVRSRRRAAPGY